MFSIYADNYVTVDLEFGSRLQSSPAPGYKCLLARHEYGNYYVLVRNGLYEAELKRLKKNHTFRVYGVVTATQLPTDSQAKITIQVDE
jgi:hypothetical protein